MNSKQSNAPSLKACLSNAGAIVFVLVAGSAVAQLIPAPTGGKAPTITLAADHGRPGDRVGVSGASAVGGTVVRVSWLFGGATETVVESALAPDFSYATAVLVPVAAQPGPAKICAVLSGVAAAELACADFTVDAPPLVPVKVTLPGAAKGSADSSRAKKPAPDYSGTVVQLFDDRQGLYVGTAAQTTPGTFVFSGIPPGDYLIGFTGEIPQEMNLPPMKIKIPAKVTLPLLQVAPGFGGGAICDPGIMSVSADPVGVPIDKKAKYGPWVSGVPVDSTFAINYSKKKGEVLEGFKFEIVDYEYKSVVHYSKEVTNPPYKITFNMGSLPPGRARLKVSRLGFGICFYSEVLSVIANPMKSQHIRSGEMTYAPIETVYGRILRYNFSGEVPKTSVLPLSYPKDGLELPFIGDVTSTLDASIAFDGYMHSSSLKLEHVESQVEAVLLGQGLYSDTKQFLKKVQPVIDVKDPLNTSFDWSPIQLWKDSFTYSIFDGPIASFWGVVSVSASVDAEVGGKVTLDGRVRPLGSPIIEDVHLTPSVYLAVEGGVRVELILDVASAGGDITGKMDVAVPLLIDTSLDPVAQFEDPCLRLSADLSVWASVDVWLWEDSWSKDFPLFSETYPDGCTAGLAALAAGGTPGDALQAMREAGRMAATPSTGRIVSAAARTRRPRVIAAPAVAAGSNGSAVQVYVADTAPGAAVPKPQLMARLRTPGATDWGQATPLTDGSHMIQNPAVAWVGTGAARHVIAVWTETIVTEAESRSHPDDFLYFLKRQEIFYAVWQAGIWSAPVRLTNDQIADGRASIAGDAAGASLAWVRMAKTPVLAGHTLRRGVIPLRTWNTSTKTWSLLQTLDAGGAGTPDASNIHPSVARYVGFNGGQTHVAWTLDDDGEQATTSGDRAIALYSSEDGRIRKVITPAHTGIPPRSDPTAGAVDSPSLAIIGDDSGHYDLLTFLYRGAEEGKPSAGGVLSNRAMVFAGAVVTVRSGEHPIDVVKVDPIRDEEGEIMRGEHPQVARNGSEGVVVFRRFGSRKQADTYGQIMMTQLSNVADGIPPPLAVTRGQRHRWLPALTIDPVTRKVIVTDVDIPPDANATTGGRAASEDDAVLTQTVEAAADPSLDPILTIDPPFAAPGTEVRVTVNYRNSGRDLTGLMTLNFYEGVPGAGRRVRAVPVGSGLSFNEQGSRSATFTAQAGAQPIYVQLETGGGNVSTQNDLVTGMLRSLASPTLVRVSVVPGVPHALDLGWLGSAEGGVVGYRIERSEIPGGPYELAGESTDTNYRDLLLQDGQKHCYVVTGYDAGGVFSPRSEEACAVLPSAASTLTAGQSLIGKSLVLGTKAGKPQKNSAAVVSKDPALVFPINDGPGDPTLNGGSVRLTAVGIGIFFDGEYDMPARNWKLMGKRGKNKGYKYRETNKTAPAGPVVSAVVTAKGLSFKMKGQGLDLTLGRSPDPVDVAVSLGAQTYCLRFDGKTKWSPGKTFTAKKAPAPSQCPMPGGL